MKMIPSRQLATNPGKIWNTLEKEGLFVITKDGNPRAILLPTSDQTLLEDIREETRGRARRAVTTIRRTAARKGVNQLSMEEIEDEISKTRQQQSNKTDS